MATPPRRQHGQRLSRDQILQAATELADASGLEALSIRTIAAHLGVSPMALYRHVTTKDEIVDLVVGEMMARERPNLVWPEKWDDIIRFIATTLRDVIEHHPVVLETVQRRAVASADTLEGMEHLLGTLLAEGLDRKSIVGIYSNVISFAIGHASLRFGRVNALAGSGRTEAEESVRIAEQVAAMPADRYPHTVAANVEIAALFDNEIFQIGVERIIAAVRVELGKSLGETSADALALNSSPPR